MMKFSRRIFEHDSHLQRLIFTGTKEFGIGVFKCHCLVVDGTTKAEYKKLKKNVSQCGSLENSNYCFLKNFIGISNFVSI